MATDPAPTPTPAPGAAPASAPAAASGLAPAGPGKLQQRRWLLLLLAVLAAAVGTKLYFDRARVLQDGTAAAPAIASADLAASAPASAVPLQDNEAEPKWGQPGLAAERVGRAASAALATARAAAGLAPQPPAEFVMDLCGVGRLTLPRPESMGPEPQNAKSFEMLPAPLGLWARAEAWPRVLAAMEAEDQPERTRAAALVLRASGMLVAEASLRPQPPTATDEASQATRSLARLARRTSDTTVMSWALGLCDRETKASADCKRLSPSALSKLAPDEVQGWLMRASAPGISPTQRQAAMDKAAQAERLGGHSFQLAQAFDAAWPADLPEYLRLEMLVRAMGVDHSLPEPWLSPVARLCSADALADPQRKQQCEAIGRKLQATNHSLYALGMAARLGQRLGWPEADVQALKAEEATLMNAAANMSSADQPYACQAVESTRQWLADAANLGELQALRLRAATQPTAPKPANNKP